MKIGLMFANSGPFSAPDVFRHLVLTAERCGIESIWTVEHVVIPQDYKTPYPYNETGKIPGGEEVPIPDPLIPLGYAAAITKKLILATGIVILPQRHPVYLAKELATIDLLSGGRMLLGIGSGWLKEEFDALGLDFHTRGRRTDEAIEAMRALWRDNPSSYHGRHFSFGPVKSFPKPLRKSGIPIAVGGHSRAAARRAARYGDGFFPALGDAAKLKEIIGVLHAECAEVGRNPAEIEISCMGRATLEKIKVYRDLGIARVVAAPPAFDIPGLTAGLEKMANEVIAKL